MAFVAVGFDTTESLAKIADYEKRNGYPWTFSVGSRQMAVDFAVLVQSTKFGIGSAGVVDWRSGYGTSSASAWEERLQALVALGS